ncbi:MAG: hypothetical protein K8J31_30310 [Anaerolineae bacterium]|nr:hypothetical protein [Anaerolineae bacterium]
MLPFSDEENDRIDEPIDETPAVDEETFEIPVPAEQKPLTFWAWLRGLSTGADGSRLDALTRAIARNPDSASNYVLRGELYMDRQDYVLAATDFELALNLAAEQFKEDSWGLLSQALRDQAERGLERARRKLVRGSGQIDTEDMQGYAPGDMGGVNG